MNGLSLRVSAIKSSQNLKKNSEIQSSVLKLPDKYLDIHSFDSYPDVGLLLTEYDEGVSTEFQLVVVKKLFGCLENHGKSLDDPSSQKVSNILRFLSEIYFLAPLKHPIRNAIARNFEKLAANHHRLLLECLVETVSKNLDGIKESSSVYEMNDIITSCEGCVDNFEIGALTLSRCFDKVFEVLLLSIESLMKEIEKPNSPANLNELFIFLHVSIRLSLWCVQRCASDRSLDKGKELTDLSNVYKNIIERDSIPMDTKLNCGIFIVMEQITKDNLSSLIVNLTEVAENKNAVLVLCYCYGLCNTLSSSQILIENGSFLIEVLQILRTVADENSNDQTILLGVCRALNQMTKSFLTVNFMECIAPINVNDTTSFMHRLLPYCLNFVYSYFEHHLDTVRHFCKDIFRNILKLSHKHDDSFAFIRANVLSTVMRKEISRSSRYMVLENLCANMEVKTIIDSWPTIFQDLFIDLTDAKCLSCYQKLMTMHCKEVDTESWYDLWIRPVLHNSENVDFQVKESLVNIAIKTHPLVAGYFLQEKGKLPLELYLFVVSTIRKNGLKLGLSFMPADDELICKAKFHQTDEIRIMHLRIFVEVHQTTQKFTPGELNEILGFLYYNSNCQSPAFRQKVISFMTKAFNRFEASYSSILKDPQNDAISSYTDFLTKMKLFCISNIFSGANFSRRSISLNLLLQTIAVSSKNNKIQPTELWTTELFDKIIKSLSDSYEANKILAVEIIRLCPRDLVPRSEMLNLQHLELLVTSVKPSDCVTAAYSLEYCCVTGINFNSYFEAIVWCEQILIKGLHTAQSSLLVAARTNPLYGLVFCIRHLIDKAKIERICHPSWRDFVNRFVKLCKELTNVVSPIVNSSSPEGHLPNDFSDVEYFLPNSEDPVKRTGPPNKILSSRPSESDESLTTTPQMLLLCAWRTVKEVSLLLGQLTLNASIADSSNQGLITVEEILDISSHFHVLLSETKHRGAFEQAFVGFSKLCVRLWRAQESSLHQLPMMWLKNLLNIIAGNEGDSVTNLKFDKICATRRSAGVPFMIQALLTSELQVCTNNGLKYSMRKLIEICKFGVMAEARTHALNILRALFRCTDLGDSVGEYISEGVECAIRGYASDNWPERNSSTLLFSSLIVRVFGVQRTKDSENLSIRNKMTGRIFFLKYPRLFDFFFMELQSASECIRKDELPPTLHPLLILLSRLYPSAVDGCESNLKLSSFLPLIAQCTCSPELGTRKLAVKSIVSLIPQYQILDYIDNAVNQLEQEESDGKYVNSNAVHGKLLQIYHLVKAIDQRLLESDNFVPMANKYLHLQILRRNNFVLVTVYVNTLIEIFRRLGCENIFKLDRCAIDTIDRLISNFLSASTELNGFIGFPLAIKSCLLLHLMVNINLRNDLVFLETLHGQLYEYVETTLNIILLILNHRNQQDIVEQFEIEMNELHCVNYLRREEICELSEKLRASTILTYCLIEIIDNESKFYPFCTSKAYTILSELNSQPTSEMELITLLSKRCIDQIDDVRTAILKYVGANLLKYFANMTEDNLIALLKQLRQMCDPSGADQLRSTAASVVSKINRKWTNGTSLMLFSDIILLLLRDECLPIREHTSQFVQNLIHDKSEPIVSSLAEERYIDWLNSLFRQLNPEHVWKPWIQLIQMQLVNVDSENEHVVDEVFDKCEANMFGEVLLVCKKIYRKVEESLTDSHMCGEDKAKILSSLKSEWPQLFEEKPFSL